MKKVLVTAKTSYIGTSFCEYVIRRYPGIKTECISLRDGSWRGVDFSSYDAVFHVAGIAHADIGSVDFKKQQEYYAVNADLAVEVAEKAKREGVNQFIFMSSMIIY